MRLFHLDAERLDGRTPVPGLRVRLDPAESRHLLKVNRRRRGDPVDLTDGRGRFLEAVITDDGGPEAELELTAVRVDPLETASPRLVLAAGLLKGRRFELLLEKAVELGAHAIVPLATAHAEVAPRDGKMDRWRGLLVSAMKQSGRCWLPRLDAPVDLTAFIDGNPDAALLYGLARSRTEGPESPGLSHPARLFSDVPFFAGCASIVWLVGPEGGWDDREIEVLRERAVAVRLGPHRLRGETAAMAGLAMLAPLRESLPRNGADRDGQG